MHDQHQLADVCYKMAYIVLPKYAFSDLAKVEAQLAQGNVGAAFFYVITCKMTGAEPDKDTAHAFVVHAGELDTSHRYLIVQFPAPSAIPNLLSLPKEALSAAMKTVVLAPYFSAIIIDKGRRDVEYYVLGQSPESPTSFRQVTLEFNANLGPGCEPELESFLTLLRQRTTRCPIAGVGTRRGAQQARGKIRKPWWNFWN